MPLAVNSETINKQKLVLFPFELCTAANQQWMRFLDCIACNQRPRVFDTRGSSEAHMTQTLKKHLGTTEQKSFEKQLLLDDYSPTPWMAKNKCYSKGIHGLQEEIEDYCQYISPMPAERLARDCVVRKLQTTIHSMWPSARIEVYGSYDTGLYLPTSDIDFVIKNTDIDPIVALNMLEGGLKKDYDEVKVLKSKVPIVKLIDRQTSFKIDISINSTTGLASAQFVKAMLQQHSALGSLVLVLKQFLQCRGILESFSGGISSYCLILMTISYLQLHSSQDNNLGLDLLQLLELYGRKFNYMKCAIRVINGGSYFSKAEIAGQTYSLLKIEDPFDASNDVGQACYGVMKVREEINRAFQLLGDAVLPQFSPLQPPKTSILGRIITVSPEVFAYRKFIQFTYCNSTHPTFYPDSSTLLMTPLTYSPSINGFV